MLFSVKMRCSNAFVVFLHPPRPHPFPFQIRLPPDSCLVLQVEITAPQVETVLNGTLNIYTEYEVSRCTMRAETRLPSGRSRSYQEDLLPLIKLPALSSRAEMA